MYIHSSDSGSAIKKLLVDGIFSMFYMYIFKVYIYTYTHTQNLSYMLYLS